MTDNDTNILALIDGLLPPTEGEIGMLALIADIKTDAAKRAGVDPAAAANALLDEIYPPDLDEAIEAEAKKLNTIDPLADFLNSF